MDPFEEAVLMIHRLSSHFKVRAPLFEFQLGKSKRRRGIYIYQNNIIVIHQEDDWRNTLLHEFAHHLVKIKFKGNHHHGGKFCEALYQIVNYWYGGKIGLYTWDSEYKSVAKYPEIRRVLELRKKNLEKVLAEMGH